MRNSTVLKIVLLKPMTDEIKVVDQNKFISYIYRNYNFIKEVSFNDSSKCFVKKIKPINKHFNLHQFGESVLSWSKHIMNQVMSAAEQHNICLCYNGHGDVSVLLNSQSELAN